MKNKKKVVGITGSMRDGSSSRVLLEEIANGVEQMDAEFQMIDLAEYDVEPVDVSRDEQPQFAKEVTSKIEEANGVILCTPVYHGSYSSSIKSAIDHCGFEEFEDTTIGLAAVAGGAFPASALDHLRIVCRSVNAWVIPKQIAVPKVSENIDSESGQITDEDYVKRARKVGRQVVEYSNIEHNMSTTFAEENEGA